MKCSSRKHNKGHHIQNGILVCRVYDCSQNKFSEKIKEGGEFYKKVNDFHAFVKSRNENLVENRLADVSLPTIRIDGRKTIEEMWSLWWILCINTAYFRIIYK